MFILIFISTLFLYGCTKTKEFTVSFQTGFEEKIEDVIIEKGQVITSLPELSREGFNFKGWFTDNALTDKYNSKPITEDVTLYAKWEKKTFTVKFMDGDKELKKETVEFNSSATAPTEVNKEGYTFKEWDNEFNEITSDLTVNAIYEIKSFTVIFKVDGAQYVNAQTVKYNESATKPENPSKIGHTFKGWDNEFTNVKEDLVINALWDAQKFTVVFYDENDNVLSSQTIEYGKDAKAPTAPAKEGYAFDKWDTDFTKVTSNLTVKAIYKIATFTVKFMSGGVQIGDTQIIEYNKNAIAPETPVVPGKEFVKWDKEFTNVKNDLVINAEFTLYTYEINYYHNGEKLTHEPDHYTVDDVIFLTDYNLSGYIFLGWYLNPDFAGPKVTEIDTSLLEVVNLYGKFLDQNTVYNISYELNGGSWTWNAGTVSDPNKGIDPYSDLPEMFMLDFFNYLQANNLLTSPLVDSTIHQTTWAGFSQKNPLHGGDPYAVYNDTTSNTAQTNNGYSQLFFTTATGDSNTGELLTISGGFLGTEPYKSKYLPLVKHIARLFHHHPNTDYQNTRIWNGASGKSLMGFVLDGYFYGTQGARTGKFLELRSVIPNTNYEYQFIGDTLTKVDIIYNINTYTPYTDGLEITLVTPTKNNYIFDGWYANPDFTGQKVTILKAGEDIVPKLYAKWRMVS